jgi:hypothetical protein
MNRLRSKLELALIATAFLTACGTPGVPLPPSLELARPVNDLRAVRKGAQVFLTWSAPTETTDRHNLRKGGPTEICRSMETAMDECGSPVAKLAFEKALGVKNGSRKREMSYTDQLPRNLQVEHATSNLSYAVSVLNPYGRSAGLSNQVQVPAAPTLAPPADFKAQLTADGVQLRWRPVPATAEISGIRYAYRIYRREQKTNKDSLAAEVPVGSESSGALDRGFEWEKTYDYRATVVTFIAQAGVMDQQVEGDDTAPVRVVAHDVFPPKTPSGLQAVFSGPGQKPFIDLVWSPNGESDLAGYNVYRHEQGGQAAKINSEIVKAPVFRDNAVLPGRQYFYSITAVDVPGNESRRSEEATETVPAQ